MSRVLDELRRDHRNMAKILAIVEGQMRLIREGRIADLDLVERAMGYSLDYPDLCHHPKEDLIFERVARRLADAVRQVVLDFQVPRDRFVEVADAYVAASRLHMQEEEAELFPLAEKLLAETDWAEIDAAAEHRPDPLFGGTLEDRYLSLHQRILQLGG